MISDSGHVEVWRGPQGGATELLAEADNVDILATDAVYGVQPGSQRGSVIAHTDGDPDSAAYSYYFRDRLGTPQVIRDGSKVLTGRQQTSPYGVPMVSAGIPVDVGYTGHKWDQELDSFYAPYRYYNPRNARWSVRDPLGMVDGLNFKVYARNNPVSLVDGMGTNADPPAEIDPCTRVGKYCGQCCDKRREECLSKGENSPNKWQQQHYCCMQVCLAFGEDASGPDGDWAWKSCEEGWDPKPKPKPKPKPSCESN